MSDEPASNSTASDPGEIVLALCHEASNLVAAAQLQADLLDPEGGPAELARLSEQIRQPASHAGSLLACVRPLLRPVVDPEARVRAASVVRALRHGLSDAGGDPGTVEISAAEDVPDASVDAEVLHQLLLVVVLGALEAGARSVRVSAREDGGRVDFCVEDDGNPGRAGTELCGRSLGHATAAAILRPLAGSLEVERVGARTRVRLRLPLATPRA